MAGILGATSSAENIQIENGEFLIETTERVRIGDPAHANSGIILTDVMFLANEQLAAR